MGHVNQRYGERVIEVGTEGSVIWRGLALPFHLLCGASEIWAYGNGFVHPDFCLIRRDMVFFAGDFQLALEDRRTAEGRIDVPCVEVTNQRLEEIVTRTRAVIGKEKVGGWKSNVALKIS